jgi:curved DNA-binding protein CbpA
LNYDTGILLKWGMPYDADAAAMKKRFRDLAKLYHPDTGGDEGQFIALMEDYKKLTGR